MCLWSTVYFSHSQNKFTTQGVLPNQRAVFYVMTSSIDSRFRTIPKPEAVTK